MAIEDRSCKAFRATRALGIPDKEVKPILQELLEVFERNWELIEADSYRALIDAYFESKENQGQDKGVINHGSSERPSKKLHLRGKEDHALSAMTKSRKTLPLEAAERPKTTPGHGIVESSQSSSADRRIVVSHSTSKRASDIGKPDRGLYKKGSNGSGSSNPSNQVNVLQRPIICDKRSFRINDIAKGAESVKISLVDEIGNEDMPKFTYMRHNIVYQNAHVHISLARIADEDCCSSCSGDCLSSSIPCACARETGGEYAYTQGGLLKEEFLRACLQQRRPDKQHPVYCQDCPLEKFKNEFSPEPCKGHIVRKFIKECWTKCGCHMQCGNRVVQRGITCKLQVFLTRQDKGWGLRALQDLPKGTFVCEYVGEILTNTELYERNMNIGGSERHTYPVTLDADWGSEKILRDDEALCLDATFCGNVARFINHRCHDANLIDIPVEVETPDRHYYHLAFFTTKSVRASEELTWDYGIDFSDHDHPIKAFQCRCRSEYCRGVKQKSK